MTLVALDSQRITFGKDTIPNSKDLSGNYYEPTDDDNFPAIDSLSTQGMFQFTVAAEHPIRGVRILAIYMMNQNSFLLFLRIGLQAEFQNKNKHR